MSGVQSEDALSTELVVAVVVVVVVIVLLAAIVRTQIDSYERTGLVRRLWWHFERCRRLLDAAAALDAHVRIGVGSIEAHVASTRHTCRSVVHFRPVLGILQVELDELLLLLLLLVSVAQVRAPVNADGQPAGVLYLELAHDRLGAAFTLNVRAEAQHGDLLDDAVLFEQTVARLCVFGGLFGHFGRVDFDGQADDARAYSEAHLPLVHVAVAAHVHAQRVHILAPHLRHEHAGDGARLLGAELEALVLDADAEAVLLLGEAQAAAEQRRGLARAARHHRIESGLARRHYARIAARAERVHLHVDVRVDGGHVLHVDELGDQLADLHRLEVDARGRRLVVRLTSTSTSFVEKQLLRCFASIFHLI